MLEVPEPVPLRHQQILEAGSEGAAASEANNAAWLQGRELLRARASAPSLTVKTVTSLARAERDLPQGAGSEVSRTEEPRPRPDVAIETVARPEETRPGGRRFGSLIHAILATINLDADGEAVQASAALQGRMRGATNDEIDTAITAAVAALRHPVLRRAARAGKGGLRRETPVLLKLSDGTLAEGVLDLAFREADGDFDGWTVVDFKTDREFSTAKSHYLAQVRLYAQAVAAATRLPAKAIILVV
jgi:ATP-dependent helicase/nuclease subunit A